MSRAPILTLTGNLLAERTFHFETWKPGATQRAARTTFQVGGKGINVAKMLARLNVPTEAWAFAGGAAGADCREWLAQQLFGHRLFPSTVATRTGLVVRSATVAETTFLGPDAPPDPAALAACTAAIESLPDGTVLALCGSFPGWDRPETTDLKGALGQFAQRGRLYVDTYGPPLAWAVHQRAALIKINYDELAALTSDVTEAALVPRLEHVRRGSPVQNWVITDGAGPVHVSDRPNHLLALAPPVVEEVSPTGSGDVFLAALLYAREFLGCELSAAVQFALPYGAANAAHPGIAEFDLNTLPGPRS